MRAVPVLQSTLFAILRLKTLEFIISQTNRVYFSLKFFYLSLLYIRAYIYIKFSFIKYLS